MNTITRKTEGRRYIFDLGELGLDVQVGTVLTLSRTGTHSP